MTEDERGIACSTNGINVKTFWSENLNGNVHLKDLGENEKIY
jgi:hypothetical protein